MAKAKPIPDLTAEQPYGDGAAGIFSIRGAEPTDEAQGVLDTSDIERVHDMRVASRRLRAALEVFEPCFPKKAHRPVLKEVKALADALGERRDRDVNIEELERISQSLASEDRPGVGELIRALRSEQQAANAVVAEALERIEEDDLRARLIALAGAAGP